MLSILAIVMGNIDIKQRSLKKGDIIVNLIVSVLIFNLMTFQVIAFFNEPLILNDINEINYYIETSIKQKLSYRDLPKKIQNREYQRLDNKTKEKLTRKEESKVEDFIKNPILIRNNLGVEEVSEKVLSQLILEDLDNFMTELGEDFCYIKNEYKIKLGNTYNYIDLLLFNIKYNCYVVIELKVTELKKEHIGQINMYMNYIDRNIKRPEHNPTIGIIICKKDNYFVIEYSSNPYIFRTLYIIS